MTAGKRCRFGRTPPRIFRNTDGDSYAIEANTTARFPDSPGNGPFHVKQEEYDDGNGLWITLGESPFDQGFSRKYYPQGYTPGEA